MSKISRNIKKLRASSGLTQEELAGKIHVTRQTVSSWETDRTQPDLELLQNIAEVFGVEPEEIIYGKKRNTTEEKEKQLFGNTLITVLSVLGCLLIGAGVVMVFINWWQDFPDILKLLTCFIPALAGQGFGIYTYIKKKESRAWCEGASVLWMLGVGVTTAIVVSQVSYIFVNKELVYFALSAGFLLLMIILKSLSPLAVVHACSLLWMSYLLDDGAYYYLDLEAGVAEIIRLVLIILAQVLFMAVTIFASGKINKKQENIILYTFSRWINFVAVIVFICLIFARTEILEAFISLVATASIVLFAIGQKEKEVPSPGRVLGLPLSAGLFCFLSVILAVDFEVSTSTGIIITIIGLMPLILFVNKETRPENPYLRRYGILLTAALFVFNLIVLLQSFQTRGEGTGHLFASADLYLAEDILFSLNFPICLAALIMLAIYGAKERKLLYLNLGFILSCISVIFKLYLLEMGLIMTGIILILCGAALLYVNLRFSRLRQKEKLALLEEGEGEEE